MSYQILVVELCELDPSQLKDFIESCPYELPYRSQMYVRDIEALADTMIKHESLNEAIIRVQRYAVTL